MKKNVNNEHLPIQLLYKCLCQRSLLLVCFLTVMALCVRKS